jgi:hypothetical protein
MHLTVNTAIPTSFGEEKTGMIIKPLFDTSNMTTLDPLDGKGTVRVNINMWVSVAAWESNANAQWYFVNGSNVGVINFKLSPTEIVKVEENCTVSDVVVFFYQKTAVALNAQFGWDVTVTA